VIVRWWFIVRRDDGLEHRYDCGQSLRHAREVRGRHQRVNGRRLDANFVSFCALPEVGGIPEPFAFAGAPKRVTGKAQPVRRRTAADRFRPRTR
jgi:hypothetical protein